MTEDEFVEWLRRDNEVRCTLVEFDYIAEGSDSPTGPTTETLYFSDREFHDDVTDRPYVDVIRSAPQYNRALSGDQLGQYTSSISSLELDNADGQLDFLLSLACDGSAIRFYYGGKDRPVSDFFLIFKAVIGKVSAPSFDRISVTLKDAGLLLDKSVGGMTTVGGTGANADRSRPVNFGYIHNLAALVADNPTLLYVHSDVSADSPTMVQTVEVRDRGVSVAYTDNGDGTFTLSAPPDGIVTCDVLAEPNGSDQVRISDAMDYFVGERAGLSALGLYAGPGTTFTVDDADDYKVGVSLPESRNIVDLLSEINTSGNCFWAIKRTGEFTFGRLRLNDIASIESADSPTVPPVEITEDDIDEGSFRLEHAPPLYYKFQAYMDRNWVQQTDFAAVLSPDEQATYSRPGLFLLQPDSVGTSYENAPELYHKTLAISPVIDTLLSQDFAATPADLDSLGQWMATRRATQLPWIETISITVGIEFYGLEIGDPVTLTMDRYE
jgi:hypothetical protein